MPSRILRDLTDSEKVNSVSIQAEVLMYRLFMKADDFGSYYSNPRLVKSALFPLKDNIRETDITRWMDELRKAGLIFFYEVGDKKLLRVINFNQRLRNMRNAFPHPDNDNPQHIAANCSESPPETKGREVEVEEKGREGPHPLKNSNLFRQPKIPTEEEVHRAFFSSGGTEEMAARFYSKHNAVGWFLNGSPITNFINLVAGFISSWQKNEEKNGTGKQVNGKPKPGKSTGAERLAEELRNDLAI